MDDINEKALDPGIRDIVMMIRRAGFETTDSGDGKSKPPEGRVFNFPHVVVKSTKAGLLVESEVLLAFLDRAGKRPRSVEASYNPVDASAIIFISWSEQ